jgi:phenylalanyl-tRNA synthetase beta chain
MKVALDVLRRWVDLPDKTAAVRTLFDECGLEVKRIEPGAGGPVFVLELLANRGDHRCYEGIARELHGRLGGELRLPRVPELERGVAFPVRIETPLCLLYTATLLERRQQDERMPEEAARVLEAAGIHAISGPVDATNIANLEWGQPTHSFDADTIEGTLTVRLSRKGERAWPLFRPEPVELPEGTLVIADERKILGIAGVIGCEESKTTASTRRLLLESAAFDPVAVRKASQALKLHTDASARFERGSDPDRPLLGAARVVELLEGRGAWVRSAPTTVAGDWHNPRSVIPLSPAETSRFLALSLDAAEIAERLGRYGFTCRREGDERLLVSVPSWRVWDVEFPADLYEELAKSVGYDKAPTALPEAGLGALPSPAELRRAQIDEVLVGNGLYEVFTDGFYSRQAVAQLGVPEDHPLARHVETQNAVDRNYSLLKNNCLHQAIEAVAANERRRVADVKIFEWTRTFHPCPPEPGDEVLSRWPDPRRPPCTERKVLWAVVSGRDRPRAWQDTGRPADAHYLKGLVEELAVELGLDLRLDPQSEAHPLLPFLHPGRRAAIVSGDEVVGVLGEVHPAVCKRYKLKTARPCYLEIAADELLVEGERPRYLEPEVHQPLVRSVTLGLPLHLEAADVMEVMHAYAPDSLAKIDVVDLFLPETSGATIRSLTFELHYTNLDAGLTADAVNAATDAMIRAVLDQFGSRGVHQR